MSRGLGDAYKRQALDIPLVLCDRDVRITLRRAWHNTPWLKKGYLLAALIASFFEKTELDEDKLAAMRRQDVMAGLMAELGEALPQAKRVLIDERDIYMSEQIRQAQGSRIVAVVGAGHLDGLCRQMARDNSAAIPEMTTVLPVSRGWNCLLYTSDAADEL